MKKFADNSNDPEEVFCEETDQQWNEGHYYRDLVLRSVASFFVGAILSAFYKTLGFSGAFLGVLLCLLSGFLFRSL